MRQNLSILTLPKDAILNMLPNEIILHIFSFIYGEKIVTKRSINDLIECISFANDDTFMNALITNKLNLSYKAITSIPKYVPYLTNLTSLYLQNNQIIDIRALSGLTNLKELNLDNNQIMNINALAYLTNLKELSFHNNQITDISALEHLTNLTDLWINHNKITNISALKQLTNLRCLVISYNNVTDISAIESLTKLIYLDINHNQIALSEIQKIKSILPKCNIYV